MKKIYNEFFYVPQHGKGNVREKVMVTRITFSVVLILVCMAAMSLTAYAYFSHNLTVNVVPIRTATWDITATAESDVVVSDDFYVLNNRTSESEREFTVTLAKVDTETSATVGYVRIDVKTDFDDYTSYQTYYSEPIGEFLISGEMVTDLERVIKIVVPAGKIAHIKFTGEWGTCAKQPVIEESEVIKPNFAATVSIPADTTTNTESEITSGTQQSTTNPTETKPTESTTTDPTTDSTTTDTTASTQAETESITPSTEVSSTPTTEESNEEN